MARKVILDVDPGIDDAVAMCLALFDPRLEVVAVTAGGGKVGPDQATRNVQAVIEQLDPPRWPRVGAAATDVAHEADARQLHGCNGLGDVEFDVAELHQRHASEKVICEEVRAAPEEVTIVALGPLTNLARALRLDPDLAGLIGQVVIMGGTCGGPGDVTPAAEFNIYADPLSARAVFRSPITKTVIPLDVTRQILLTYDQADELPRSGSRTGELLARLLPPAFRAHRQYLGLEGTYLHDAVALLALLHPELFEMEPLGGDVETVGELTRGATIFDRRTGSRGQPNMEVAVKLDRAAVTDCLMRGLKSAG